VRLLVTGAGGLIGRHVAQLAAADPAIDLIATARRRPDTLPDTARFASADLSNPDAAAALVREVRPTHLIHCAWETRQPTYWHDLANLDWVVGAARMGQAFATSGGVRFVQLGSCAEYDWSHGLCIEGVTPDSPATRYGKAKLAAFHAIEAAAEGAFEAVEARIFFVYGPGENADRFIPYICRSHLAGRVPELGDGRQWRDLLHAEDAGRALLMLATATGLTGIVNIGGGVPTALAEVATELARAAGTAETGLARKTNRAGDPTLLVAASDRIRSTGWTPQISLKQSLAATLAWWRRQRQ
jgi:nucleoside-diphosphate-sugar epimerase